jgi:O-antigen/teichoic acid export membrane protein
MFKHIRNSISVELLIKIITFLASIVLARVLGSAARGEVAVVVSAYNILVLVANFGFNESIIYHTKQRLVDFEKLKIFSILFVLLIGILFVTLFLLLANHVTFLTAIYRHSWFVLVIVTALFCSINNSILVGSGRYGEFNISRFLDGLVYSLVILVCAISNILMVETALMAMAVSSLICSIYLFRKVYSIEFSFKGSVDTFFEIAKQLTKFARNSFLGTLAFGLMAQLPVLYLAGAASQKEIGIFSVQYSLIQLLLSLIMPSLLMIMSSPVIDFRLSRFYCFYAAGVSIVIPCIYLFAPIFFVVIYGEQYAASGEFFAAMSWGLCFQLGAGILNAILKNRNYSGLVAITGWAVVLFYWLCLLLGPLNKVATSVGNVVCCYNVSMFLHLLILSSILFFKKRILIR